MFLNSSFSRHRTRKIVANYPNKLVVRVLHAHRSIHTASPQILSLYSIIRGDSQSTFTFIV